MAWDAVRRSLTFQHISYYTRAANEPSKEFSLLAYSSISDVDTPDSDLNHQSAQANPVNKSHEARSQDEVPGREGRGEGGGGDITQLIWEPSASAARLTARGLAAMAVMNMAEEMVLVWKQVSMTYAPTFFSVPFSGELPQARQRALARGKKIPPARAATCGGKGFGPIKGRIGG